MCFFVQELNNKPFIAKRDIAVYKVLSKCDDEMFWRSPYFSVNWVPDETKRIEKINVSAGTITVAFHSFYNKRVAEEILTEFSRNIFIFTIPAGSTFYINTRDQEIVSTALQFKETGHFLDHSAADNLPLDLF